MTAPDQRALDVVGRIAARRALGWRALAEAFGPPSTATVIALCAGSTRATIVYATEWLDSDRERFAPGLDLLDAYSRAASVLGLEAAVVELSSEHKRLFAEGTGLVALRESAYLSGGAPAPAIEAITEAHEPAMRTVGVGPDHLVAHLSASAALAERERGRWVAGDAERAKALRVLQRDVLLAHQARFVPALCDAVTAATRLDLYRAWAGVLLGYLSIETGVDYGRTVLSPRFQPAT